MPVRKLQRNGSEEACDSPQPDHQADQGSKQEKQANWSPPGGAKRGNALSGTRVNMAAQEIITALHEAKQDLAAEMEANLKQLKSVLQETQRIAKEMEAVLQEAKAKPNGQQAAKESSQGKEKQRKGDATEDDQGSDWQGAQTDSAWEPPPYREEESPPSEPPPWEPPTQGKDGSQSPSH